MNYNIWQVSEIYEVGRLLALGLKAQFFSEATKEFFEFKGGFLIKEEEDKYLIEKKPIIY
jgi:hypothetical protein